MNDDPAFGGSWTDDKLVRLDKYLRAYRQIFLKNERASYFHTTYVDGFAGSGKRVDPESFVDVSISEVFNKEDAVEVQAFQRGSVEVALSLASPFQAYRFIEKNPSYAQGLERYVEQEFPNLSERVEIVVNDANSELQNWCAAMDKRKQRAVVFLDPYGMQVDWQTIEAIAATEAIDMWLLFPLGQGVNRLLTRREIPQGAWAERLTKLFGTDTWQDAFYEQSSQMNMFNDERPLMKTATFQRIQNFFVERLKAICVEVAEPRPLFNSRNIPLYLLCFAATNPRGAPTAVHIAQDILRS